MSCATQGIRHIEIRNKDKYDDDNEDNSDSDGNNRLNVTFEKPDLSTTTTKYNKSQKHQDKSENVKLDSLLQAVIDIGDRIQDHEDNLHKYDRDTNPIRKNDHDRYFPPKHARPKTAVLRYKEPDDLSDDADSFVSSNVSHSKMSVKRRPLSGVSDSQSDMMSRMNMSFSNDKVRNIDMENQRLLKELLRAKSTKAPVLKKKGPVRVQSASGINRSKRQQEIERENMRFLQRLQTVKPTGSLSKVSLLTEHTKLEQASARLSRSGKRPSSAPSSRVARPTSGRSTAGCPTVKYSDYDNESVAGSTYSGTSSRKSSFTNGAMTRENVRKIERRNQWNDACMK